MPYKFRIRDILSDFIGALCVFALPLLLIFIGHGIGL